MEGTEGLKSTVHWLRGERVKEEKSHKTTLKKLKITHTHTPQIS